MLSSSASAAPWNVAPPEVFSDEGRWTRGVELADLDGDGRVDLLFANVAGEEQGDVEAAQPNQAYRNTPEGFLDVSVAIFGKDPDKPEQARPDMTWSIAAGDLDGDGDLDLLLGRGWGEASALLRNAGDLMFLDVSAASLPPQSPHVGVIALADVDGDDDLDALLGDLGPPPIGLPWSKGARIRLWRNTGAAHFVDDTEAALPDELIAHVSDLALADLDGDWDLDLVVACEVCEQGGRLYRNDGLGGFTDATPPALLAKGTRRIAAVDVDGDDLVDLVTLGDGPSAGEFGARDRVLLGDGDGGLVDATPWIWPIEQNLPSDDRALGVFDFENDGDGDLALGSEHAEVWPDRLVALSGEAFAFHSYAFGGDVNVLGTRDLELAHLDDDPRIDVVLAAGGGDRANAVLLGTATKMPPDTAPPTIARVEEILSFSPGETARVRAIVHDGKTPPRPHDWQSVRLEWVAGPPAALIDAATTVASFHAGGHLWTSRFVVPAAPEVSYRQCAVDRGGNKACSQPVTAVVDLPAPETETDAEPETTDATTDATETGTTGAWTDATTGDATDATTVEPTTGPATTAGSGEALPPPSGTTAGTGDAPEVEDDGCGCASGRSRGDARATFLLLLLLATGRMRARHPRLAPIRARVRGQGVSTRDVAVATTRARRRQRGRSDARA
ncbi:MAG: FG-GAP-like repeat-containing protein [Nannocystaceae bacterium]